MYMHFLIWSFIIIIIIIIIKSIMQGIIIFW